MNAARNPHTEALAILGGEHEVRVLEPAPPAVTDPPFADDPLDPGEVPDGRLLVSPISDHGDLTWDEVAGQRPEIADWCAERWLGAWRPLEPLPPGFDRARAKLHRLAEEVVSPERLPENEIALRWTLGGFGTPFFDDGGRDCQVRVERGELVRQRGAEVEREPVPGVDAGAATALGEIFGFGCSVLEELRGEYSDEDPSAVQLWPEHFDIAFELGREAAGARANYGLSPGDDEHPEPYLYVGPWNAEVSGELWNATGFPGAELTYSELLAAPDQRRTAIGFMRSRHAELAR